MTLVMKLIFPFVWIGGFAIATIAMWTADVQGRPAQDADAKWIFTIALIVGAGFILKLTLPLKRVEVEGNRLLISNYFSNITVSSDQIESVYESSRAVNPRRVVIRFKKETAFGREITFIPKNTLFKIGWTPHPVVAELRALAEIPASPPAGPEAPAALRRVPGFLGLRQWLGDLYAIDPIKLLKRHLYGALLIGGWNALCAYFWSDKYAAIMGATTFRAMETMILSASAALFVTSALGLMVADARKAMLALQSLVVSATALGVAAWAMQLILVGLPRRGSFSWGPGLLEALAGYAAFMVCRFLLPENAHHKAVVFYLPILVAACVVPLDIGIPIRFFQLMTGMFQGNVADTGS